MTVEEWLLDSDPAIRRQVMRDLIDEPRIADSIALVEQKRDDDGPWILDETHEGEVHFDLDDSVGKPSRWITLRPLRVLRWAEASRQPSMASGARSAGRA